ncbi:MAG: alpha/beta fold hydrolase [Pseudomonadota bacterium]
MNRARWIVAGIAVALIVLSVLRLEGQGDGLMAEEVRIGTTPATRVIGEGGGARPAVVIAHGFSGSRPLMRSFAQTLAGAGYAVLFFDFLGHGRNATPMSGNLLDEEGAGRVLLTQLQEVIAYARSMEGSDGRIAVLGHSMGSDIVTRAAVADPTIVATVAISMFSNAPTAEAPANLLLIAGGWERFLREAALEMVAQVADGPAEAGVTYGSHQDGSARRAVFAPGVEHVGVLYDPVSLEAARDWLDASFGRPAEDGVSPQGPWILLLLAAIVALGWPLAALLPTSGERGAKPDLAGWRLWIAIFGPALLTPLIGRVLPTGFLPVLIADYLAVHFAIYGVLTFAALRLLKVKVALRLPRPGPFAASVLVVALWGVAALALPLDAYVSSYVPHAGRVPLILALLAGTLLYTIADELLTRGTRSSGWAYALSKVAVVLSLILAVVLNPGGLFFLLIIMPVIVLFFAVYGLWGGWIARATRQPLVAGVAFALAFAWALGVTFPLIVS